ncbi:MAG: tRNA (cytidine(34)-2'-O)-methyltransferase [Leptotrichiaceae bacterium]|nr:tRNA (cytidine(34)-2'-O)-methyltransferase [Leptotrichiaceae bacterium]MBP6282323.1 tRNA (cytidine(34)-2'-O)-methyltransferase [Leptotrichiaceae bacterium]MBP7101588.1 tRNA (cytidine(34)-2'-O)-methyltransferase [Leptotrichiaceae bacterium]MBP7739607.1 tRNA (cytidine(34)-2'-O)-methyltransferase [Leptotrichiaceae bacterium]MBP9630240.1 tRNA (cytidine(34)-2'-O)-methyltransferase [Leptotrichiaceae bacterium]
MNIVFLYPEIPTNTGNISRTCVLTNTKLHLIKPFGFSLDSKYIKRGGLDYWDKVQLYIWEDFNHFYNENIKDKKSNIYFATTKTNQRYSDIKFGRDDFIMFGPESKGIPEEILNKYKDKNITIPMLPLGRSINLANSASIILYEALRQNNFEF